MNRHHGGITLLHRLGQGERHGCRRAAQALADKGAARIQLLGPEHAARFGQQHRALEGGAALHGHIAMAAKARHAVPVAAHRAKTQPLRRAGGQREPGVGRALAGQLPGDGCGLAHQRKFAQANAGIAPIAVLADVGQSGLQLRHRQARAIEGHVHIELAARR